MGTPAFAAASLKALLDAGHELCGVYTQPDKPKGRGHKLAFSEVKTLALQYNLPVYQPKTLREEAVAEEIRNLKPELIAVVAYGKILPDSILAIPPMGCVNIHGSLLPAYRGSAPIQHAVLNGEKYTGVCSMFMASEMDAGDIIFSASTEIGTYETASALFERLAPMGAELLLKTVEALRNGTAPRTPQNADLVTFAPPLNKSLSPVDWHWSPEKIIHLIYGLQDWPCATTEFGGKSFRLFEARYTDTRTDKAPGSVLKADKQGIEIACGEGRSLLILELQDLDGGKRMAASAWLLGHSLEV